MLQRRKVVMEVVHLAEAGVVLVEVVLALLILEVYLVVLAAAAITLAAAVAVADMLHTWSPILQVRTNLQLAPAVLEEP